MRADPPVPFEESPPEEPPTSRASNRASVSPVGGLRLEASFAIAVSVLGLFLMLLTVPSAVTQWHHMDSPLGLAIVVLVYGSITLSCLAGLMRQWMRVIFISTAVAYLIALALFHLAFITPLEDEGLPWISLLASLCLGFLVLARRDWVVPLMYSLLTCALIGFIRTTPDGGDVGDLRATLDGVYVLALDAGVLLLILAGRQAARSVDGAQNHALERFSLAQVDQATEVERVQIDALVHDSVLTTFLSAASAHDRDAEELAGRMAVNAIAQLAAAEMLSGDAPPVTLGELAARIRREAGTYARAFSMHATGARTRTIPGLVADALVAAAAQAMVNSMKHAGDATVSRSVRLSAVDATGVRVVVADRGVGFNPTEIDAERLGVRVSIKERLRSVGGAAAVVSAVGRGTVVTLEWPDPARTEAVPLPNRQPMQTAAQ